MNKIYFPNLNGLRFIAALLVIVHHVEQFKEILGLPNYSDNPFIKIIGKLGVMLFFVLSGYLITYLLLLEEQTKGEISIKHFYIRRALRIWPLYFLIIIIAFFITPNISVFNIGLLTDSIQENFWIKILFYVLFLPNLALGLFPPIPFASQLWSIGYEEQFYLVWPVLIKKIKNKKIIIFSIISIFIVLKIVLFNVFDSYLIKINLYKTAEYFFDMPSIDCMAIGSWFSYVLYKNSKVLNFLFNKKFQIFIYLVLFCLTIKGVKIPFLNNQFYSILFGILILNLSANPNTIISLENKLLNLLGKISYGLYMYHAIIIVLVLKTFSYFKFHNIFAENIVSVLMTIGVAFLSYKYIEERFIKLKGKF